MSSLSRLCSTVPKIPAALLLISVFLMGSVEEAAAQQLGDTAFAPVVESPAFLQGSS